MALVNGPLFSLGASGQLGKAIVYSKWKGRDYVREYVVPANPRSLAQIFQRQMLSALARWWSILVHDSGAQESWNSLASAKNISNFNALISYNLEREQLNQSPIGNYTGGQPAGGAISPVTATSPEPGRIIVNATLDGQQNDADLVWFGLGTDGGANTTANDYRRTLGGVAPDIGALSASIDVSGLPPGDYFVAAKFIGTDGTADSPTYTASAVTIA